MRSLLWCILHGVLAATAWSSVGVASLNTIHDDYRKTPKILLQLEFSDVAAPSPQALSRAYLEKNFGMFGIADITQLQYVKVTHSLLGHHFHYQQFKSGVAVDGGEIIVSVENTGHSVFKVFNNYYPETTTMPLSKKLIGADAAMDIAWNDLRVHGKILAKPTSTLFFRVSEKGKFSLGYKVLTEVDAPAGAWENFVDADSGAILSRTDTRLERIKRPVRLDVSSYKGVISNRLTAMDDFARKELLKSLAKRKQADVVNGHGLVFDPDPRTTLMNADLQDESEVSLFDLAYFDRQLLEISQIEGKFHLKGPWVTLADFESPNTEPSVSEDGSWSAKRGTDSFNDAMTYFQIDQSQRYMQSLGFVNEKGIQFASIEVDSNGVSGDDNSHYIPSSNRLSFGHGCVDDNEDTDVILHEYGHAINHSINSNWEGGDTGAMGEGFGDYWAGSYSISTPNGLNFQQNVVFNWDGVACWPGRSLNAAAAIYHPDQTYRAHSSIDGGFQSDELWSTPIFQSLVVLMSRGVLRSEVDKIILEAQFGLGAGLKMRDMANQILATAKSLYPEGIHADVLKEEFLRHNIVEAAPSFH